MFKILYQSVFLISICLVLVRELQGFATHLTKEHCDRELNVGVTIMGKKVEYSPERKLTVFRGGEEMQPGGYFRPGDVLTINIEATDGSKIRQMVLELSPGTLKFDDPKGACGGKRTILNGVTITIPDNTINLEHNFTIKGCWAKTYSSGVKVVQPFSLVQEGSSSLQEDL